MHHSEEKCAHFSSEWCIVGYGMSALWDMGDRSITHVLRMCCGWALAEFAHQGSLCVSAMFKKSQMRNDWH